MMSTTKNNKYGSNMLTKIAYNGDFGRISIQFLTENHRQYLSYIKKLFLKIRRGESREKVASSIVRSIDGSLVGMEKHSQRGILHFWRHFLSEN